MGTESRQYKHELFDRIMGSAQAWAMYIFGLDTWVIPVLVLAAPCLITMYLWQKQPVLKRQPK